MTKRNKIIYWIATIWLSLGMVSTGVVQLLKMKNGSGGADSVAHLGYPLYLLSLLAIFKFLGVITVLMPKFPLLKEWAYAGFVFMMTGAIYSHIAVADKPVELFGPGLLLVLTMISWYFRPADKRIVTVNQ